MLFYILEHCNDASCTLASASFSGEIKEEVEA